MSYELEYITMRPGRGDVQQVCSRDAQAQVSTGIFCFLSSCDLACTLVITDVLKSAGREKSVSASGRPPGTCAL